MSAVLAPFIGTFEDGYGDVVPTKDQHLLLVLFSQGPKDLEAPDRLARLADARDEATRQYGLPVVAGILFANPKLGRADSSQLDPFYKHLAKSSIKQVLEGCHLFALHFSQSYYSKYLALEDIAARQAELATVKRIIAEKDAELAELDAIVAEKDAKLAAIATLAANTEDAALRKKLQEALSADTTTTNDGD